MLNPIVLSLLSVVIFCSSSVQAKNCELQCIEASAPLVTSQPKDTDARVSDGRICPKAVREIGSSDRDALTGIEGLEVISPDIAGVYFNIATSLEQTGDHKGAISAYEQCISLDKSNANAHQKLAEIYTLMGRYALAIIEYRNAIDITPEDPAIHCQLAKAYKKMGKLNEAAKSFEAAIRLDKFNLEPRRELIKLEIKRNNLLRAEKLSREILIIDRNDQEERTRLIGILGRQKKYVDLAHFLTDEISRYPAESLNYYRLGLVKESLKDYKAATDAFLKSIALKATANSYFALARIYMSVPDSRKAREALIKAAQIDPKREDVNEMLSLIDKEYNSSSVGTAPKSPIKGK